MTEEELDHLHRQLPSLPVGWEPAVADLIAEVRRLQGVVNYQSDYIGQYRDENQQQRDEIARLRATYAAWYAETGERERPPRIDE